LNSSNNSNNVPWGALREILTVEGEKIESADLDTYLSALLGESAQNQFDVSLPVSSRMFATKVLGFEDEYN
jgi:hypothetical protein